jgi:hypothetical protein
VDEGLRLGDEGLQDVPAMLAGAFRFATLRSVVSTIHIIGQAQSKPNPN